MALKKGGASAKVAAKPGATPGDKPAGIPAATGFTPAGAPAQSVPDVDAGHPAVDNDPRAGTTVDQNRIDFNDPTKSGAQVVAEQLGMKAAKA